MGKEISVEELCKKLRPMLGSKADKILFAWQMTNDKDKRFQIEQALHALYAKSFNSVLSEPVLLEPPQSDIIDGDYPFGRVVYGDSDLFPFGLREKDFPRHVCITGMSGSGKTNLGFHILQRFVEKKKPFIVFDWKSSFRPLMRLDPDLLLFTVGNETLTNQFKININRPPKGVAPKEWIGILADIINESFFASHGVHKLISESLDEAYTLYGVYKGSNRYPTWHQVKTILEEKANDNKRGRENEWLSSALRIAHSLTFGGFGETINAKEGRAIEIEDVLNCQVIFEMQSLGASEKKFFCEYILTYIYKLKKGNRDEVTSDFRSAIIVDEAHNIFLKDKPVFMKESIVESLYREIREYGISLICMDQHISKLSEVVPGNSACNVAFQQMLPQDIQTSAGVMMMSEKKEYFSMLPVGQAIVRLAERYHRPFLIKVPFMVHSKERFSDAELVTRMENLVDELRVKRIVLQCMDGGSQAAFEEGSVSEEITEDNYEEEFLRQRMSLEKRFAREKEKIVEKIERNEKKELEKIDFRLAGVGIRSEKEEVHIPKNRETEAVERIHGPKEFIVPHSVTKRATIEDLSDRAFAREHRQKEEGTLTKQLKFYTNEQLAEKQVAEMQGEKLEANHPNAALSSPTAEPMPTKNITITNITGAENAQTNAAPMTQPTKTAVQSAAFSPLTAVISHSLTTQHKLFLRAVQAHHDLSVSQVYKLLALSGRKGNQLKDELVAQGLIEVVEARTDKGWTKHMKLTPESHAVLAD